MEKTVKRNFKNRLYEEFARVTKALGSGRRLEIIDVLAQGPRTVEQLAEETDMSVASASQHLQVLRGAQLVEVRRDGLYAHYRLADERVFHVWRIIRQLGESRIAEIQRVVETFLLNRKDLQAVTAEELLRRMESRTVVVLDVRPVEEYRAGHILGARCLPISALKERLKEIPRGREVVAYCRGPYCVFADEAVEVLRAHGYKARRLEMGFPDWLAMGLPVDVPSRALG